MEVLYSSLAICMASEGSVTSTMVVFSLRKRNLLRVLPVWADEVDHLRVVGVPIFERTKQRGVEWVGDVQDVQSRMRCWCPRRRPVRSLITCCALSNPLYHASRNVTGGLVMLRRRVNEHLHACPARHNEALLL